MAPVLGEAAGLAAAEAGCGEADAWSPYDGLGDEVGDVEDRLIFLPKSRWNRLSALAVGLVGEAGGVFGG